MMFPPSLQEWVDENDMVHFVIEAIDAMELPELKINRRGSGHAQYPPRMMLALLIYCYAHGIMSSRKIERATYRDIPVRFLTGNTHPDHDTINTFRKENQELVGTVFAQTIRMAAKIGLVTVGTISVDGFHVKANASKFKNVRYDRAKELETQLDLDIAELLSRAAAADDMDDDDETDLPKEIARREVLREKVRKAQKDLERQAREKEHRRQEREDRNQDDDSPDGPGTHSRRKKTRPNPEDAVPDNDQQVNLVDPDSFLMRKSRRDGWQQAYNAQAVVDADGSQLILGAYVAESATDRYEIEPAINAIDPQVGKPDTVLADGGYVSTEVIKRFESQDDAPELYLAISADDHDIRRYDYRPPKEPRKKTIKDPRLLAMREKVRSDEGRKIYGKRKQTVEPVFGIIRSVLGLDQFLRRGYEAVNAEWTLVCTAYNMKRLWRLCTVGSQPIRLTGG
ncbi:MAG: IS5/IS1182 family transposase [Spirochaetaceae bacterium]|nr:MAG: IS5/IS1182 family transposase [Spirochaetaceae bacterium]